MLRKLFFNLAYYRRPIWDSGISPPELLDFINAHQPGRALDLGCGTGTNLVTLAKHGWKVIGVDFASRALKLARRKARQAGVDVDLRQEDVTRLASINGTFDLILDMGCYHSLPPARRPSYILRLNQLLAGDGTCLLYLFKTVYTDLDPGATDADICFITDNLRVLDRKDSTERGIRPSVWFTLQKKV